jgi:Beta-galactosidase/beta-glucuronidase
MKRLSLKKPLSMFLILAIVLTLVFSFIPTAFAAPSVVSIVHNPDGSFQLLKDGYPYFIKGGGTDYNGGGADPGFAKLKAAGGNSVRTWGALSADPAVYDAAYAAGVTVCAGLWIDAGINYSDPVAVQAQYNNLINYVQTYKNHPAILCWGVGNEYEGAGTDPRLWQAAEQIAAGIKSIDPNHPTVTVIAGYSPTKINAIKTYCPSIDIIGVNTYGGLPDWGPQLSIYNLDRPYIITEWGERGSWEAPLTTSGAAYQMTSSETADFMINGYNASIVNPSNTLVQNLCLGSYMHYWGVMPYWVTTHTWFETFLMGTNERMNSVDVLQKCWSGSYPANRSPIISSVTSDATGQYVALGGKYLATVNTSDPEGAGVTFSYEVRKDIEWVGFANDPVAGAIVQQSGPYVIFQAPSTEGQYRLYVYVRDGSGNVATANVPFYPKTGVAVPTDPTIPPVGPTPPPPTSTPPTPTPPPTGTAPVANTDNYNCPLGTTLTVSAPGVLANDTGSAPMTAVLVNNYTTGLGNLTLNSNGSFTFTPTYAYFNAGDLVSFTYRAVNSSGNSSETPVLITITSGGTTTPTPTPTSTPTPPPAGTAPIANADTYNCPLGSTLTVSAPGVLANDTGSAPMTAVLVNNYTTGLGNLTLNSNGSFSFTPTYAYFNVGDLVSFTYKAVNSSGNSAETPVLITITAAGPTPTPIPTTPPNGSVPTGNADNYTCNLGSSITVSAPGVLANDTGSAPMTAVLVNDYTVGLGIFTFNSNGSFSFTPTNPGLQHGNIVAFTYMAVNSSGNSAETPVLIIMD